MIFLKNLQIFQDYNVKNLIELYDYFDIMPIF